MPALQRKRFCRGRSQPWLKARGHVQCTRLVDNNEWSMTDSQVGHDSDSDDEKVFVAKAAVKELR